MNRPVKFKAKDNTIIYIIIAVVISCSLSCIIFIAVGGLNSLFGESPAPSSPQQKQTTLGQIKHKRSGNCIDSNGKELYALGCNGSDFQKWELTSSGQIKHTKSGNCLDSDGNKTYISGCNSGDFQKWSKQGESIKHNKSGNCLDSNGKDIYILGCNRGEFQKWSM